MSKTSLFLGVFALLLSACSLPNSTVNPIAPTPTEMGAFSVTVTEQPAEVPSIPASAANDQCGNQYYPVVDGAEWIFNGPNGQFTNTLSTGSNGTFSITAQSDANTFLIQGVCLDGGYINLLDVPGASLSHSGDSGSSTMTTTSNDGVTLPGDIQQGDDWSQTIGVTVSAGAQSMDYVMHMTYTAVGYETVSVPAGTFQALKITQSTSVGSGEPTLQTLWYAAGVGPIKTQIDAGESIVTELVSYNIPNP
jgi:hypothetical protein